MLSIRQMLLFKIALYIGWVGMLGLLSACDDKEDPYPGFSKMVSERHELRKSIAKEGKEGAPQSQHPAKDKEMKTEKTTAALYERQIEIIDSASGNAIAKGVAYLDKDGKITRIRIYRQ